MLFTEPTQPWLEALDRAHAQLIRVRLAKSLHPDHQMWEATSSEEPAFFVYTLGVTAGPEGIDVSCDCSAGMNGRPCKHASRVLLAMGHIVEAKPERSLFDLLEEQPTPLYRQPVVVGGRELSGRECLGLLNGEGE